MDFLGAQRKKISKIGSDIIFNLPTEVPEKIVGVSRDHFLGMHSCFQCARENLSQDRFSILRTDFQCEEIMGSQNPLKSLRKFDYTSWVPNLETREPPELNLQIFKNRECLFAKSMDSSPWTNLMTYWFYLQNLERKLGKLFGEKI